MESFAKESIFSTLCSEMELGGIIEKIRLIQRRLARLKSGHDPEEQVVTMVRNGRAVCSGVGVHNAAEYAYKYIQILRL
jgi:hypothetical protein